MKIKLFDTEIELRDYHCSLNNKCPERADKYVNIYVRLENTCNAKCKFCEFRGSKKQFDFYKFYYIINEINKMVRINKVSFTGGEPTTNIDLLYKCLTVVKNVDKNIFTVINTNGYNLINFIDMNINNLVNSIALSRHHYDDDVNNEIFGTEMLSLCEIQNINKSIKNKIHLSCNLINGYIDSKEEIFNYLNDAVKYKIYDVGFVSLMKVNDYCNDHFIDFSDIDLTSPDVLINKNWNNEDKCKCRNHVFIADNADMIEFYSRYYASSDNNSSGLVYDIDQLKNGFNGKIIL